MTIPYDPTSKWIKKGSSVPEDSINLAYVDSPELSPADYVQIVDESSVNPTNNYSDTSQEGYVVRARWLPRGR
jgi:hypothetical protein